MRKIIGESSIYDVAKKAGVSLSTVSRAFNQPSSVNEKTRSKIVSAAQELNYIPQLQPSRHSLVINIPSISNPFYSEILKGAKSCANQNHCDMFITEENLSETNITDYIALLKCGNIKGLITLNPLPQKILNSIQKQIPVVQCCEYDENTNVSCVYINNLAATEKAMQHILATNHTQVALINGPESYLYSQLRYQGYVNTLQNAALPINKDWIVHLPEISAEIAFASAVKMLSSKNIPNAFFTVSDLCAAAIIRAIKCKGLRIPEDIVVVGFDNLEFSNFTVPSITTVNQPSFQLGYIACDLLYSHIQDPTSAVQHVLLDTNLIIRESSTIL